MILAANVHYYNYYNLNSITVQVYEAQKHNDNNCNLMSGKNVSSFDHDI